MRVVSRRARFLDVRARVRAFFLEKRRKGEDELRHGEEENRRTPEGSRENAGMGHEGHTLESLVRSGGYNNGPRRTNNGTEKGQDWSSQSLKIRGAR